VNDEIFVVIQVEKRMDALAQVYSSLYNLVFFVVLCELGDPT